MNAILVKLKCLTNLHVGNGDVNYNIVDNEVERDPVTGFPTINSSGVKGALRNHFKDNENVIKWFGNDPKEKKSHKQGALKILNANMLAMPLRATSGNKAYHLVYTDCMLDQYDTLCTAFSIPNTACDLAEESVHVEGFIAATPKTVLGECAYRVEEDRLKKTSLPVIARNYLENGKSSNLWYEEVVPHESIFYFIVASDDEAALAEFVTALKQAGVIQFGGNASIGYGLCQVTVQEA